MNKSYFIHLSTAFIIRRHKLINLKKDMDTVPVKLHREEERL
jgi:hypothetical protein